MKNHWLDKKEDERIDGTARLIQEVFRLRMLRELDKFLQHEFATADWKIAKEHHECEAYLPTEP